MKHYAPVATTSLNDLGMLSVAPDLDLLHETGPLARLHAAENCMDRCHAYHAVWPFFRLFGSLPSVARDHDAVLEQVGAAAADGCERILVSGSADSGILSYVIEAYARAGRRAEITVVDLCQTPLELCRYYAAQRGWAIRTQALDARSNELGTNRFDLVVSHNFLSFFGPEERILVASNWARSLRPSGRVLAFSTVKLDAPASSRRFDPDRTEKLVRATLEGQRQSPYGHIIDSAALEALIRDYAVRRITNHIRSEDEIGAPLTAAGLQIERTVTREKSRLGVPDPWRSRRSCLIAQKP